ncbi:flavoprotein family protein [Clostridium sp. CAG:217]|nr:flavoprotein family protein [Clostridium sp. CAG:217]
MQVLIVGGGAAGLCCAIRLRQLDPAVQVTVLERLEQPGKKLLATGNGRCNLTNMQAPHSRAVLNFFASLGLMTRQEDLGRVYPYSLRAATVQNLLLDACRSLGVRLVTGCRVEKIIPGFTVQTDKGVFAGDKVVVACGGQAQPALGSDGSGYALLQDLGHSCTPLYPALVQLTSSSKYPRKLKGQRTRAAVAVTLDGEIVAKSQGLWTVKSWRRVRARCCLPITVCPALR